RLARLGPELAMLENALAERAGALERASRPAFPGAPSRLPPAPWIQEDPGSRMYQTARDLLSRGRFGPAAQAFADLRETHPESGYVPDSYYWQAFALSREGRRSELGRALDLLDRQAAEHPDASTRADAHALRIRIEGELA